MNLQINKKLFLIIMRLIYILISILLNVTNIKVHAQTNNSNHINVSAIKSNTNVINNFEKKSSYALYKNEINQRFKGGAWEQDLTKLSDRALMQEYVRIIGISNHLASMNIEKKQRIEALLATYTSMQLQSKMKTVNDK